MNTVSTGAAEDNASDGVGRLGPPGPRRLYLPDRILIAFSDALDGLTTFAAVIGIITLLLGATAVFAEIQDSVNSIWNLKPKPKKGWLKIILNRLLSFSVVVGLGFILLVSLIVNGLIEGLMNQLQKPNSDKNDEVSDTPADNKNSKS